MKKERKFIILKEDAQVTFSNTYSRWSDSCFYCTKAGDKIEVEIKARQKDVRVTYFPPEPCKWLNPVEKTYNYDEYIRLIK